MYLRIFLTLTLLLRNLSSLAEEKHEPIDCEDVIQENEELKAEIKCLNDVITNNISEILDRLNKATKDIDQNSANGRYIDRLLSIFYLFL